MSGLLVHGPFCGLAAAAGKTWTTVFDGLYTRRGEAADQKE